MLKGVQGAPHNLFPPYIFYEFLTQSREILFLTQGEKYEDIKDISSNIICKIYEGNHNLSTLSSWKLREYEVILSWLKLNFGLFITENNIYKNSKDQIYTA